jgi:hypothetical protein
MDERWLDPGRPERLRQAGLNHRDERPMPSSEIFALAHTLLARRAVSEATRGVGHTLVA